MDTSVEVKILKNPKKVVKAFIKDLISITHNTNQQVFNISLSGGKTPNIFFEIIAAEFPNSFPWKKIHFWWGDERCVPADSKESNFGRTRKKLLSKINIPEENIHPINGEADPVVEADRYSKEIDAYLNMRGEWPVFDLIILGLGSDGHTASIFPDEMEELMDYHQNCSVAAHPITGQKRITLTGKVLNNSNRVYFIVTGKNKAMRISEIMNDDEAAKLLPAYYIQPENGELVWYLDEEAASLIR